MTQSNPQSNSQSRTDTSVPVIALPELHQIFVKYDGAVNDVLRMFQSELRERKQHLAAAAADSESLNDYAHSLRGTAATIYARPLAEVAGRIEIASAANEPIEEDSINTLKFRMDECLDFIENHLRAAA